MTSTVPPAASIFALAAALKPLATTVKFLGQFAVAENLDAIGTAIGQTNGAQRGFIHPGAVFKLVQLTDVDRIVSAWQIR